ncbi:30S ribosomal protein S1 [Chondrus crispus]|uniref:30S ribosomal protein S1 n=1 Tax=Chondrus crispus TaxID=2769 RepID=R7QL07_CHOCR|nr:30S ribosomal protein S1 [Chondrus crispus]CDF38443.1 30S ribosomal protein S1 [Chondrus crispus]|eukprot:XP_005718336.1 30S ribosomal protein S1 [Chondrus crispus]
MAFVNSFYGLPFASNRANPVSRKSCSRLSYPTRMVATARPPASNQSMSKFDRMRDKYGLKRVQPKNSGFTYEDFETAISEFDYSFEEGDICSGRVFQYEPNGALIDIGAKASAYCPVAEMSMIRVDKPEQALTIGEDREFQIISREDANGQLKLSIRRIEFGRAWERVAQLQAEDVTVHAEVISVNRGGCLVMIEGLRAFLPGSHISLRTPREDLVGVELPLKFLEVDTEKNRLVVSHRRAVVEKQMTNLVAGEIVKGVVRGIKPYGAFVDIGGISGLLHVSQISHDHVADIGAVVQDGSEIKCMIINQDKEKGRISLSTKTLEPEPGDMIRDSAFVYEKADEMAARYHKRLEEERKAAADVADDIVSTLDMASLDDLGVDPVATEAA